MGYRHLPQPDGEKGRGHPHGPGIGARPRQGLAGGRKLKGGYALTRFKTGKDESWLLVKADDAEADPGRNPVADEPGSVLTGRTIEEMSSER